jgi:aliphatic sulfonates family ABC transporter substrate-binding protein
MTALLSRRHLFVAATGLLAAPSVARAGTAVRVGYQKNGALVIVRRRRLLEAEGLAPDYVEFPSGPPLLEALAAGAVDFGATGDTPPIFAQAAGSPLVYVGAQPIRGANQTIIVHDESPVRSLGDLRGRRVGFTKGSSAHNMVVQALATVGLTPTDIQATYLQPPDAGAAFRAGALDAWGIWDPFLAIAEDGPGTRVLASGDRVAPTNSFFLANRRFADTAPETVIAMLHAINVAAAWARDNPEPLAQVLSEVTGVPIGPQRVAAARGVYAVQPLDDGIIAQQQAIADTFAKLRIIPTRIDVRAAVWTRSWQVSEAAR